MDPFVDQLAELCRTHVTRSKWVFVPTHAIGRTLGDRLVLEGTDWANLRFVTPLDIALLMGAPFLVERRIDPSEEELGPALMMRLLLALPREGGYFRPLAGHPTLAQPWRDRPPLASHSRIEPPCPGMSDSMSLTVKRRWTRLRIGRCWRSSPRSPSEREV